MAESKDKLTAEDIAASPLPVGHPKSGYVSPDLSYHVGTGDIPDAEKEWHEERNDAQQEDAEKILDEEEQAAKEEQEERDKQTKIAQERALYVEKQKYGETAGKLPGDASYVDPAVEKSSTPKTTKASA
jgi:hypothetical protein